MYFLLPAMMLCPLSCVVPAAFGLALLLPVVVPKVRQIITGHPLALRTSLAVLSLVVVAASYLGTTYAYFESVFSGVRCDLQCFEGEPEQAEVLWTRYALPPSLRPGCDEFPDVARRVCDALDRDPGLAPGVPFTGWAMYGAVWGWSLLAPAFVLVVARRLIRRVESASPHTSNLRA